MSLSEVLNTQFDGDYTSLFTHNGGYLYNDTGWTLSKKAVRESEKLEYFTKLAKSIVENGIGKIKNPEGFVKRFNEEWTPCVLKDRSIFMHDSEGDDSETDILFSSKIKKYSFLSNFFPTLILLNSPGQDGTPDHVYYTSEHAYLSWKIANIDPDTAKKIATGTDPLKTKKEVSRLEGKTGTGRESKEKVEKMIEIVTKKFEQNPALAIKLSHTNKSPLLEATKDEFWGIGNQTGNKGKNYLGKVIMKVRKNIYG